MTQARHALPTDRAAVVETLADAFSTDPVFRLLLDPAQHRADHDVMVEIMNVAYDCFVVNGHTYVVDERGAGLWSPPGITTDTDAMSEIIGRHAIPERLEAAFPGFIAMGECHPPEAHFYLMFIGARSTARGQGLGTLMLERVLRICDDEGVPAYLEATTAQSAALYERHGFETVTSIGLGGGVTMLPMVRLPTDQHAG